MGTRAGGLGLDGVGRRPCGTGHGTGRGGAAPRGRRLVGVEGCARHRPRVDGPLRRGEPPHAAGRNAAPRLLRTSRDTGGAGPEARRIRSRAERGKPCRAPQLRHEQWCSAVAAAPPRARPPVQTPNPPPRAGAPPRRAGTWARQDACPRPARLPALRRSATGDARQGAIRPQETGRSRPTGTASAGHAGRRGRAHGGHPYKELCFRFGNGRCTNPPNARTLLAKWAIRRRARRTARCAWAQGGGQRAKRPCDRG